MSLRAFTLCAARSGRSAAGIIGEGAHAARVSVRMIRRTAALHRHPVLQLGVDTALRRIPHLLGAAAASGGTLVAGVARIGSSVVGRYTSTWAQHVSVPSGGSSCRRVSLVGSGMRSTRTGGRAGGRRLLSEQAPKNGGGGGSGGVRPKPPVVNGSSGIGGGVLAGEQPPLLVRAALVGSVTGLMTPFYFIMAIWRSIYHFVPDPFVRTVVFGGASAIASWLAYTLLPDLYKHAELLAPIAIANMIASGAIYLVLDVVAGGPRNLLVKRLAWLPAVGALVGAGTGVVAPFLYLPLTEWFFEMEIPRDWITGWGDFVFDFLMVSVFVPTGMLAGATLQPALQHAIVGVRGFAWPAVALPVLGVASALSYWVYFTEVVDADIRYEVIPPELIRPELSAIFRVSPDCHTVGSTVLRVRHSDGAVDGLGEDVADGGALAARGTAARAEVDRFVADARARGVKVFETRGRVRLQRAMDRFGKGGVVVSVNGWDHEWPRTHMCEAQAVALRSDAVRCVIARTPSEASALTGTTTTATTHASSGVGHDVDTPSTRSESAMCVSSGALADERVKWDAMARAADAVAREFPLVLARAGWNESDLAAGLACASAYDTVCTASSVSPRAALAGSNPSLLELTETTVVGAALMTSGFGLRPELWAACTPSEVQKERVGQSSISHFFSTFGTHTPPIGAFIRTAESWTRLPEVETACAAAGFPLCKSDYYEYARRHGGADDVSTLLRVGGTFAVLVVAGGFVVSRLDFHS